MEVATPRLAIVIGSCDGKVSRDWSEQEAWLGGGSLLRVFPLLNDMLNYTKKFHREDKLRQAKTHTSDFLLIIDPI